MVLVSEAPFSGQKSERRRAPSLQHQIQLQLMVLCKTSPKQLKSKTQVDQTWHPNDLKKVPLNIVLTERTTPSQHQNLLETVRFKVFNAITGV